MATARNLAEGFRPAWIDPSFQGARCRAVGKFKKNLALCAASDRRGILSKMVSAITKIYLQPAFDEINGVQRAMEFQNRVDNARMWIAIDCESASDRKRDRPLIAKLIDANITSWRGKAWIKQTATDVMKTLETSSAPATISNSKGKGRKRGPKPDLEGAARLAEIVARIAPDGEWRPKEYDICEVLDAKNIPIPTTWRRQDKNCLGWSDQLDRQKVVKVIEYRLDIAKQRKKTTPETFS